MAKRQPPKKKPTKKIKTARELAVEQRARGERDKAGSIAKVKEAPTSTEPTKINPGGLGALAAKAKKEREERRKKEEERKKKKPKGLRHGGLMGRRR